MTFEEILEASRRISSYVHKTPVMTCSTIDELVGRQVFFKCEIFQKTGSFKARGALNAVLKLKETSPNVPGVVTHSSGNHGQALAWAAQIAGLPCSIVVPNNSPKIKMEAIKGYEAELVLCEPTPQSRSGTCEKIAKETGKVSVHACDLHDVIAGQGTIGYELMDQVQDLDAILVPVGGGGGITGIAIAAKKMRPSTKVFAVEPKGKDLGPCLKSGRRLWENPPKHINTICDGLRTHQVGHITFPLMCQYVEKEVFTVDDEEAIEATKLVWQRMKLLIEPSTGAGVAAVLSDMMKGMDPAIKRVAVILSGGNLDIDNLPW